MMAASSVSTLSLHWLLLATSTFTFVTAADEAQKPTAASGRGRYADPAYWEEKYKNDGSSSTYEWFLNSDVFLSLMQPYLELDSRVLQLGCGNSNLAGVMAAANFTDVTSVDISPSVISASIARYPPEAFPALHFVVGDVFAMKDFKEASFDVAVDKGTWDAIPKTKSRDMLREVRRVLKPQGLYMVLTFSRPSNALDFLLDWRVGWKVEDFITVPNPRASVTSESLNNFYLYLCRNEDRQSDWVPQGKFSSPEVLPAIEQALEFQKVTRQLSAQREDL